MNSDNPYKDMPDDQFVSLLESCGFKVVKGTGKIISEDDVDLVDFENDETTKGRMKISRTEVPTKSKHKHDYYPVLIANDWNHRNHYMAGVKCATCGNIRWDELLFNKLTSTEFPFLGFDDKHFIEEYRELEIVKE